MHAQGPAPRHLRPGARRRGLLPPAAGRVRRGHREAPAHVRAAFEGEGRGRVRRHAALRHLGRRAARGLLPPGRGARPGPRPGAGGPPRHPGRMGALPHPRRRRAGRARDAGGVRAADGQLRARRRRELQEGLLPGPGDRGAHAVPRHPQEARGARAFGRRRSPRARASTATPSATSPRARWPTSRLRPEGGFEALVVAQLEAIARADLRHGSLAGPPLALQPLPYPF